MMEDRFAQQGRFNSALQRQGNCGRAASGWLTITAAAGMDAGARAGSPGWRGLWKRTRDDNGTRTASFAVPLAVFDEIDDGDGDDDMDNQLQPVITWALETLEDRVPEGWAVPDGDALSALVPDAQRSLRFAGFMARLEVTAASDRLRLAVGVTQIAADLAPQRRRWLDVALDEASALGMARVVVRDQTVEAEVDLSGVPTFLLQPLVVAAVHALDACYRRLVVPASVIGGPFSSRMLERSPEDWHSMLQPMDSYSTSNRRSDA